MSEGLGAEEGLHEDARGGAADAGGGPLPPSPLKAALDRVRCHCIVIIDDRVADIEVIRASLSARQSVPAAVISAAQTDVNWPEDPDGRWGLVATLFDALSFEDRKVATAALFEEFNTDASGGEAVVEPFVAVLAEEMGLDILALSPREWIHHGPKFDDGGNPLAPNDDSVPICDAPIYFFDYDLSLVNRRSDEGLRLARQLVGDSKKKPIYCGIISQTFNGPGVVDRLARTFDARERDRMVLVSRSQIQNPAVLADKLNGIFRAQWADQLRELAWRAFETAHRTAMEELSTMEVAPLLHAVAGLSYLEGVSEFETLRRIYTIKLNRALSATEGDGSRLQNLMREIRAVDLPQQVAPQALVNLEHEERFLPIDIVNAKRLPIELGDVFEITSASGETGRCVLVAHPCDLMVRSDGRRPAQGETAETTFGTMLPVSNSRLDDSSRGFELEFARPMAQENNRSIYVRFRPVLYLPLFVLDLCALSGNGVAILAHDTPVPDAIPLNMQRLHERLRGRVSTIIGAWQARAANPAADTELKVLEGAAVGVRGRIENHLVHYDCKRVMRVASHVSSSLLLAYSHFAGRDAAAMILARSLE